MSVPDTIGTHSSIPKTLRRIKSCIKEGWMGSNFFFLNHMEEEESEDKRGSGLKIFMNTSMKTSLWQFLVSSMSNCKLSDEK